MIDVRHQMIGKAHLRLRFWWVKKKKIKTNPIFNLILIRLQYIRLKRGCSVRSHMVVGFTTTCAISVYHHLSCEFKSRSWRGVLETNSCDNVCQWLAKSLQFSLGTLVSFTKKTDCNDITEILLKVALNTLTLTPIHLKNNVKVKKISAIRK
jgi:hypothetical protein